MNRITFISVTLLGILALGAGMWLARSLHQSEAPIATKQATVLEPPRALPQFELISGSGTPYTLGNLQGQWSLLFFGFTHCPAICPNTLTLLQQAHASLQDLPQNQRPQVIFVSVDPERDTPQKVAEYVSFFGPSLQGVSGSPDSIAAFTRAMGVPVVRVALPDGGYTVDHSAAIFLINPRGELQGLFGPPHTASGIAQDYRTIVRRASS